MTRGGALAVPWGRTLEESNSQSCRRQTTCCMARPEGCPRPDSRTRRDACNADSAGSRPRRFLIGSVRGRLQPPTDPCGEIQCDRRGADLGRVVRAELDRDCSQSSAQVHPRASAAASARRGDPEIPSSPCRQFVDKLRMKRCRGSTTLGRPDLRQARRPLSQHFATVLSQMPEECSEPHMYVGSRAYPIPRSARSSWDRSSSASRSVTLSDLRSSSLVRS